MAKVAIALGGNLGKVDTAFSDAVRLLSQAGMQEIQVSSFFQTTPVDCAPGTPDFLNGALIGEWPFQAETLLQTCQKIEIALGRPASHGHNASRTIDLDIILFGNEKINLPELMVPHPRAVMRGFVMIPLAEIAPDWIIPGESRTVAEIAAELIKKDKMETKK